VNAIMRRFAQTSVILSAWLLTVGPLSAQYLAEDKPKPHVPVKPTTVAEAQRLEAVKVYALAAQKERDNHLLEAATLYEEAARLDPKSPAPLKALIPLYLALDRIDDAFAHCEKVLERDPNDYETGYLYARQLRVHEKSSEALVILERIVGIPKLKNRPDVKGQLLFDIGVLDENAGNNDKAVIAFRALAEILENPAVIMEHTSYTREEIDGQAAETYERLGRLYLKTKEPARAIDAFEQARKKDPARAARLAFNLAQVYASQGKKAEALERLDDYLRTQPQGMEAYELKIDLLRQLGRRAAVVPELEAAANRDSFNNNLKLLLATEYRRAGRASAAEDVYNRLIGKDAFGPDVFRGLFRVYQDEGDAGLDRLLNRLDEAVQKGVGERDDNNEKKPGDAGEAARARSMLVVLREDADLVKKLLPVAMRRLQRRNKLAYETRMALAVLAARTRTLDIAEALYRDCLDQPGGPREAEQDAYSGLLRVLWQARKYEAVVAVCQNGLKRAAITNRVLFHESLARALMNLDRVKESLEAADNAVKDAGDHDRLGCRCVRAELFAQGKQFDKAIAECQAMLKEYNLPGEVVEIRHTLSGVYSLAQDYAGAEEQLQKILEVDPSDATANNDLGYQWADQNKNLEEAERLVRKALELDQRQRTTGTTVTTDADLDNAAFVDSLGWVLFRRGRFQDAAHELERASKLPAGTDDPVIWDHLADTYSRLKQEEKAREAWRKALSLYDGGRRRKTDDRYQEIKQKLRDHTE
jgi:tetratricopeptide (TPR) repeat protein